MATLDSHHLMDIAHPLWWQDSEGKHAAPFTAITLDDVESGRFRVSRPQDQARSLEYLRHLKAEGKKTLVVWPPHCLLGHPGHQLQADIREALDAWETETKTPVEYVVKGMNPFTEHYSAVRAEMTDPQDPATSTNRSMIDWLNGFDRVFVVGEAKSHCVADTVSDLCEEMFPGKIVLITDAMSSVPGFDSLGESFVKAALERGVSASLTTSL